MMRALMMFSLLVAACGGSKSEPAVADKQHDEHAEHAEHDEHGGMPAEVKAFHDTFAPHYHAAKNAERMKGTCAAIPDFTSGAAAIAKAPTPTGVEGAAWTDATGKLAASIESLDATCKANDATAFEPAFEAMHNSFHGVMEAAGGHQEHHEMKPEAAHGN